MTTVHPKRLVSLLCVFAFCSTALGSEIGQEIADQISAQSFRHYLDDLLYTHDGDDRDGMTGPQHDPARNEIVTVFQDLNLEVELHSFAYGGGTHYNVVATQIGTMYPDAYFVIGGHYDSAGTPGADDDASGVAGVMEIARVFSQYETKYTIKYMAFDLEEYGLIGSNAYAQQHSGDDIVGMISLDMIAYNMSNACDIYGRPASNSIKQALAAAVQLYGNGLTSTLNSTSDNSDHAPFELIGVPACLLIEEWGNSCYHLPCDSVDSSNYIDYDYAADMTRSVAGWLADQALAYWSWDCDGDGIPDADEIQADPALDCNGNGRLDACEAHGDEDCNENGIPDLCDVFNGTSQDCQPDGIPDDCQDWADCNANGILDQCDLLSGASEDCNGNGVPDECDLAEGTSLDCNANTLPDDCELSEGGLVVYQAPDANGYVYAQSFDDLGVPQYSIKEWDDFTVSAPTPLGKGSAFFTPPDWSGFWMIPFLVEIADAPGGAEAGANVVHSTYGYGEMGSGLVSWDFNDATLPAGTWWLSVQAMGGYNQGGFVYWRRSGGGNPNGSEHYFHNPGGGWGVGTAPVPGSAVYGAPADLAFLLRDSFTGDCNHNGVLDECDLAAGTSVDLDGNGVPDECQDLDPPVNLRWIQVPTPISTTAIRMEAAADDPSGTEYSYVSTGIGSHNRDWDADPTFTDTELEVNRNYNYSVKARDGSAHHNETPYLDGPSLATLIETPTALTFGAMTSSSIVVNAPGSFTRLSANMSGLYFEVLNVSGAPVGGPQANTWVQTQTITATGLTAGQSYRFRVKARNYFGQNETPWYPASGYIRRSIPIQAGPVELPGGHDVGGQEVPLP
jgi:hypothetical protein